MATEEKQKLITEPESMKLTEIKPTEEGVINDSEVKGEEKKEGDKDGKAVNKYKKAVNKYEKAVNKYEKEAKEAKEKNETIQALIKTILKKDVAEITVDEEKAEDLETAMSEGKAETVKRLLEGGAPIDAWDWDEKGDIITPLTFAVNIDR